jgi:hypothetical protein
VAGVGLPAGYSGAHHGQAERMKDSANSVKFAFLMALAARRLHQIDSASSASWFSVSGSS